MQLEAEFLKLVREYLEATKHMKFEAPHEHVEAYNVRRQLVVHVQDILWRQSQPGLWEDGK